MRTSSLAQVWQRLKRLVVLVDVQVFAQGNVHASQAYAGLIHSSIERILAVCNEHNTGHKRSTSWGYKLFDSSLSPLVSSSTLQKLLKDRSGGQIGRFKSAEDRLVDSSLGLFLQTLFTVATDVNSKCDPSQATRSKVNYVVRALIELFADFNWNPIIISDESSSDEDQARGRGEFHGGNPFNSHQNLVIVFSHLPDNMEQFASFMNMPTPARDAELFKAFSAEMKRLQEPFRLQGIRVCWIDMPHVSTSLARHAWRPTADTETYREPQRPEFQAVFAQTKWKYSTMDALAIASDCIPAPLLWFSVVHPDLEVQPNARRMQCKLRINFQARDGAQLQRQVCRLEAVSLGSNVVDNPLMKFIISELLNRGSLSSEAERLSLLSFSSLQPPIVKIVVKSLIRKQDVSFKCSFRYLLYHREANSKKRSSMTSAENKELRFDPLGHDVYGHDILQQLQQEPKRFEPGDRAWQILLLAIARKNSVAEVDLYIDGDCSSAILEPISLKYAALLQKYQSPQPLGSDCNKQFRVHENGPLLVVPSILHSVVKSDEDVRLEGSECAQSKQVMRPKKRRASTISMVDTPVVKRHRTEYGCKQKPTCAEWIKDTQREAYSWIQFWQYILDMKSVGIGRVQIENRYMRPGSGTKPPKAITIIKCWLALVSKPKPSTNLQIVPLSQAAPAPGFWEKGFTSRVAVHNGAQGGHALIPSMIEKAVRADVLPKVSDEMRAENLALLRDMRGTCVKMVEEVKAQCLLVSKKILEETRVKAIQIMEESRLVVERLNTLVERLGTNAGHSGRTNGSHWGHWSDMSNNLFPGIVIPFLGIGELPLGDPKWRQQIEAEQDLLLQRLELIKERIRLNLSVQKQQASAQGKRA